MLAITVPATLFSAISLAKLGPLKTPILLVFVPIFIDIISVMDLKGFNLIPLVHEIMHALLSTMGVILCTIFSKIILGVAINTISEPLTTSSKFSEASMLGDSCNSGW